MSRYHSYINTAEKIIGTFKGEMPFAVYLKNFFSAEKKYGSRDRKQIAGLCYNYYRLGFAAAGCTMQEKIILAVFLCNNEPSEILMVLKREWNEKASLPVNKKIALVKKIFSPADIFPFKNELSNGMDAAAFCKSFLIQPDLFLRIRPQKNGLVIRKLKRSKLLYTLADDNCVQLPSATDVEEYFIPDKEVVIQDFNSQKVLGYLQLHLPVCIEEKNKQPLLSVWDCCAASGGKSILAYDILNGKIDLTVSDIRAAIILSLHQRLKKASIKEYNYVIADIANAGNHNVAGNYDVIICDAPCTGSGTWGRSPDQLCFFKENSIREFSSRQKKIAGGAIPHLKSGGVFFYITCSVFKKENEEQVSFIQQHFHLQLLEMKLLKGYDKKADSMFVAVFKKEET